MRFLFLLLLVGCCECPNIIRDIKDSTYYTTPIDLVWTYGETDSVWYGWDGKEVFKVKIEAVWKETIK